MNISALRSPSSPLLSFETDDCLGDNINGPSVIEVPEWVESPLGAYYMYFAHHNGDRIRLAYANDVSGPWVIYRSGALQLCDAPAFKSHVASPDVHVDEANRRIVMYFHGAVEGRSQQWTGVATSKDGVSFQASDQILGKFYFRVFQFSGYYYAIAKDWNSGWGELYRSTDGMTPFESAGKFIKDVRHTAVFVKGDRLLIFYSRIGDAPERILLSEVNLLLDWRKWKLTEPIEVLRPQTDYEGIQYENKPSASGSAIRVQQLRDPCIFEAGSMTYLYYAHAGEMGISMAQLFFDEQDECVRSQLSYSDGSKTLIAQSQGLISSIKRYISSVMRF